MRGSFRVLGVGLDAGNKPKVLLCQCTSEVGEHHLLVVGGEDGEDFCREGKQMEKSVGKDLLFLQLRNPNCFLLPDVCFVLAMHLPLVGKACQIVSQVLGKDPLRF